MLFVRGPLFEFSSILPNFLVAGDLFGVISFRNLSPGFYLWTVAIYLSSEQTQAGVYYSRSVSLVYLGLSI